VPIDQFSKWVVASKAQWLTTLHHNILFFHSTSSVKPEALPSPREPLPLKKESPRIVKKEALGEGLNSSSIKTASSGDPLQDASSIKNASSGDPLKDVSMEKDKSLSVKPASSGDPLKPALPETEKPKD